MNFKAGLIIVLICIAAIASANGAMGLGLEMWDLSYWFAYVVVIIGLEAWLIGRWHELSWTKSILVSIGANAVTGFLCGGGGFFAPFLHISFVGSQANPNPFMNAVALLTIFALPSAWFESIIWRWAKKPDDAWKFLKRASLVHLVTVPIGLAILLIPENPYVGMEVSANYNRRYSLRQVSSGLQSYIAQNGSLPKSTDPAALARELDPYVSSLDVEQLEAVFYTAHFTRFSTGNNLGLPVQISPELAGKEIVEPEEHSDEEWVWYMRPDFNGGGMRWGIAVELTWGMTQYVSQLPSNE